eukprot:COSAG01_NODE_55731_length_323_cov_0.691964_1_plen_55_part_01
MRGRPRSRPPIDRSWLLAITGVAAAPCTAPQVRYSVPVCTAGRLRPTPHVAAIEQ